MKYLVAFLFVAFVIAAVADARPRRSCAQKVVVQQAEQVAVATFALPVGVPVGQSQALYSLNAAAAAYQPSTSPSINPSTLDAEFAEFQAWRAAKASTAASTSPSTEVRPTALPTFVYATCSKCHSGNAPKGGFSVLGELSDADRIKAAAQVLSGKMPKGKPLSPEDAGRVLSELMKVPEPAKKNDPPPKPE